MTTTEVAPAFSVIANPFCSCHAVRGNEVCWRALCRECGGYLAFHAATPEAAAEDAELVLDMVHRCQPFGATIGATGFHC